MLAKKTVSSILSKFTTMVDDLEKLISANETKIDVNRVKINDAADAIRPLVGA